jgi:hypothetical protein
MRPRSCPPPTSDSALFAWKQVGDLVDYYYTQFKHSAGYQRYREATVKWGLKGESFIAGRRLYDRCVRLGAGQWGGIDSVLRTSSC